MLTHIFNTASIVWFGVGEINHRSRKAVDTLGATLTRKVVRELDGKPYTQMYYNLQLQVIAPNKAWQCANDVPPCRCD